MFLYVSILFALCGSSSAISCGGYRCDPGPDSDDCFDYEKLEAKYTEVADSCAEKVTKDDEKCSAKIDKCVEDSLGYIKSGDAFDQDKFVEFLSEYASEEIKETINEDLACCGKIEKDAKVYKFGTYFRCIKQVYSPKCSDFAGKFNSYIQLFDDKEEEACGPPCG